MIFGYRINEIKNTFIIERKLTLVVFDKLRVKHIVGPVSHVQARNNTDEGAKTYDRNDKHGT